MGSESLITYCGLYCGNCARWCSHPVLRKLARVLAELVDGQGFEHWMTGLEEFDYREFRKGLTFLGDEGTWLVCRKGCREGDGRPDCDLRTGR